MSVEPLTSLSNWGPTGWKFLHAVTFTYPETPSALEKEQYRTFFEAVQHVLPCSLCRNHLADNYKKYPIELDSTRTLSEWLVRIHNHVNAQSGKRQWLYSEIARLYVSPGRYAQLGLSTIAPVVSEVPGCSVLMATLLLLSIGLFVYIIVKCCQWSKRHAHYT